MKNQIYFKRRDRRNGTAIGLLEKMDADIVGPDGSLPKITVEQIYGLGSGGSISLFLPNSQSCWLESDCEEVSYHPKDEMGPAYIMCYYTTDSTKKHATKTKNYRFPILLAGIRQRTR